MIELCLRRPNSRYEEESYHQRVLAVWVMHLGLLRSQACFLPSLENALGKATTVLYMMDMFLAT
jgi:hypothetical protein